MWSDAFDRPLRIEATASRYLAILIGAVHLLGIIAAALGPWSVWIRVVLVLAVLTSAAVGAWRHLLAGRITVAVWLPDGAWRVFGGGEWRDARLGPGARWSTLWVVLPLELSDRKRRTLILGRDAVDPDSFRHLRGRLTVAAGAENGAK